MDFGMGLILSFTDNASSGIQNAVNTLNQLTETASTATNSLSGMAQLGAFSVVANQVGNSFINMGSTMLSTLTSVIGKVNETGQTLMFAENQLDKLYEGSGTTGKEVIGNISDYAKKTIFEFKDLIPVVTMLKANGIEAFNEISSSTGQSRQMLMDYAADLAAFNPQMRNAYGTGIKAAMGALNEYIAEGNAITLKRGASIDINGILGEDTGSTIEERSQQVADLMEKLHMVGMTAQLAETPMVKLSNMGDTLFQFLGMISNSGVYDKFNEIISVLADFVNTIPDSELQAVATNVGSALASLLEPIKWVAERIVTLSSAFKDLVANNPFIAQFAIKGVAVAGILLVMSGVALKFVSTLGFLTLGLQHFGNTFSAVTGLLKAGSLKMLGALLPLTITLGLVYLSWKNDLGGIRTLLNNFVANIRSSFSEARRAATMNVQGMRSIVSQLNQEGDFWSNFTIGLIKVKTLWEALCESWDDYTLSTDLYTKCIDLGILPLVSAILDLKWRMEHFIAGFKEGFSEAVGSVISFVTQISGHLKGTFFDTLIEKATEFFQLLTDNDPEAWTVLGEKVGELVANFTMLGLAGSVLSSLGGKVMKFAGIFGIIGKVFSSLKGFGDIFGIIFAPLKTFGGLLLKALGPLGSILGKLFAPLLNVLPTVMNGIGFIGRAFGALMGSGTALGTLFQNTIGIALKFCMGLLSGVGNLIITFLIPIIVFAITHWEEFKEKIMGIWTTLKEEAGNIWGSIKDGLMSIWENLKGAVGTLVEKFTEFKDRLVEFATWLASTPAFQLLVGILSEIGRVIVSVIVPAVQGVIQVFSTVFQAVWGVVVSIFNAIVNTISSLLSAAMDIISGILSVIQGIFSGDLGMIWDGVCSIFGGIFNFIGSILGSIFDVIGSVLGGILNIFISIWEAIWGVVSGFVGGIFDVISEVLGGISEKAASIWEIIKGGFDTAIEFITSLPAKALQWGKDFIDGIIGGIKGAIGGIGEAASEVAGKIKSFLHFSVPDEGPLTDYESWMPDFMEGLAEGINSGSDIVIEAITSFTEHIYKSLNQRVMTSFKAFSQQWTGHIKMIMSSTQQWTSQMKVVIGSVQQMVTGMSTSMKVLATASQQSGKGYLTMCKTITTSTQTMVTSSSNLYTKMSASLTKSVTLITTSYSTGLKSMLTVTNTTFTQMSTTIGTSMQTAVNTVQSAINEMSSSMGSSTSLSGFMQNLGTNIDSGFKVILTNISVFISQINQALNKDIINSFQTFYNQLTVQMNTMAQGISKSAGSGIMYSLEITVNSMKKSGQEYSIICKSVITLTQNMVSGSNAQYNKLSSAFIRTINTMTNTQKTEFKSMLNITNNTFTQVAMIVGTEMQKAVTSVVNAVKSMKSAMEFTWSLPNLKVPHVKIQGSFNLDPPTAPKFDVNWYAKGGVFNNPSIIGVGESGKEAVMPLENNTGWIKELAYMISSQITNVGRNFVPVGNSTINTTTTNSEDKYMTSNITNNTSTQGDTDNSITFSEGAIQINCQNASEEEAVRMAKIIMEYIKRQQQLDKMLSYG